MNEQPDFNEVLAAARRAKVEREAAEAATAAVREAERRRAAGIALDALNGIALPLLEDAVAALRLDGTLAELGNGVPLEGGVRRSMRLVDGGPVLVFTAESCGPFPQLVWHEEGGRLPKMAKPQPVDDPTRAKIGSIIADFLTRAIY